MSTSRRLDWLDWLAGCEPADLLHEGHLKNTSFVSKAVQRHIPMDQTDHLGEKFANRNVKNPFHLL